MKKKDKIPIDENGFNHGLHKKYYDNGVLKYLGYWFHGNRSGLQIDFYPNGKIDYIVNYKDGAIHGLFGSFESNGELEYFDYHLGICDVLYNIHITYKNKILL